MPYRHAIRDHHGSPSPHSVERSDLPPALPFDDALLALLLCPGWQIGGTMLGTNLRKG